MKFNKPGLNSIANAFYLFPLYIQTPGTPAVPSRKKFILEIYVIKIITNFTLFVT